MMFSDMRLNLFLCAGSDAQRQWDPRRAARDAGGFRQAVEPRAHWRARDMEEEGSQEEKDTAFGLVSNFHPNVVSAAS